MKEEQIIVLHILAKGVVQGVGFRVHVKTLAEKLESPGWVRNLKDGRVECLIWLYKKEIDTFVEAIGRGPKFSRVDDIGTEEVHSKRVYSEFEIINDSEEVWCAD